MSERVTLKYYTKSCVGLAQLSELVQKVFKAPNSDDPIGLFYAPDACRFARFHEGAFEFAEEFTISHTFEARIFNDSAELRWLREPNKNGDVGNAVIVLDGDRQLELEDDWKSHGHDELTRISNQYMLWGQGYENEETQNRDVDNWSVLASGRTGSICVPRGGVNKFDQRIWLWTCEYLGREHGEAGRHGNMTVLDERFVSLENVAMKGERDG